MDNFIISKINLIILWEAKNGQFYNPKNNFDNFVKNNKTVNFIIPIINYIILWESINGQFYNPRNKFDNSVRDKKWTIL